MDIQQQFLLSLVEFAKRFSYFVFGVISTVSSHPILLLTFGLFILGASVAIFGRIFSRD